MTDPFASRAREIVDSLDDIVETISYVEHSNGKEGHVARIAAALSAVDAVAFARGLQEGRDVSVHGSGPCMACETGRVTLYSRGALCPECRHHALLPERQGGGS